MTPTSIARAANPNPQQLEAIHTVDGPLLIIAGPGSGKTFTLVERILYLIQAKGVKPESLLVVTFTDKAAHELSTRLSNRLADEGIQYNLHELYLGTFHSICLRLLEEHREFTRLKRSFVVFDQFDQQYFLYQRMKEFRAIEHAELIIGEPTTGSWAQSEELQRVLNKVTEEALDTEGLKAAQDEEVRVLGQMLEIYHRLLDENNALDFSGIQYEALRLLQGQPEVLAAIRAKLTHLMVDEYQDTNTVQEKILRLLMGESQNICVVGDDDQGLYRFRGATIRNILEFPKLFADGKCRQVKLTTNYRSHPGIIEFYNHWIDDQTWDLDGQTFRFSKAIVAEDAEFPKVPAVVRISATPESDLGDETLAFLNRLRASGRITDWNQVAFLYRSVKNDKVVALANRLEREGIPIYSPRSNMYFDRPEVRLMLGALIFLFPQFPDARKWAEDAHLDIWKYYDQDCFAFFAQELRKPKNLRLLDWARPLAKKHLTLAKDTDYAFSGLFYQLLQFPMFSQYLAEEALHGVDKGRAARNLATMSKLLTKFEYLHHISILNPDYVNGHIRTLFNQFLRFLKDGGIDEYEDEADYAPAGCVSFLTIHQSKGLEFPVVVCGSLEAVPRKQHTDLDELLETKYFEKPPFEPLELTKQFDFRRLFYTAFSRAQNLLVLAASETSGRGQSKSPSKYFEGHFRPLPNWRDPVFRPEDMEFENLRGVNLKKEYSFTSHIALFENCAEQYRFFKDLEFTPIRVSPMLFGTLVHQTIEDIHKKVLQGQESQVDSAQIEGWFSTNYALLSKRERVYLAPGAQKAALNHVLRYFEREKSRWDRIKEAEVDISLVKAQYILKGSVDLIRGENDTVEIVDFKSEKKPDMEKDRTALDRYKHQLEVYAHLVEERTGQKVSRMHLYYTGVDDGNPYVSFTKDDRVIGRTIEAFDAVVDRIEKKDYSIPARPIKLCENCDMRAYCDAKSWKFRKGSK